MHMVAQANIILLGLGWHVLKTDLIWPVINKCDTPSPLQKGAYFLLFNVILHQIDTHVLDLRLQIRSNSNPEATIRDITDLYIYCTESPYPTLHN